MLACNPCQDTHTDPSIVGTEEDVFNVDGSRKGSLLHIPVLKCKFNPSDDPHTPSASSSAPVGGGAKEDVVRSFGESSTYTGQISGEKRHGKGLHVYPDGSTYEGEWYDDKAHGHGKLEQANGSVYIGQWRRDLAYGRGHFRLPDGACYDGQWYQDVQHGRGKEVLQDGATFEGIFVAGRRTGPGRLTWLDRTFYEGDFFNEEINGAGIYQWSDGRRYKGEWARNRMHGRGMFTWPDGRTYHGNYSLDLKDGFGILTWADGRKYEGEWKAGKEHGNGTFYTARGQSRAGIWKAGQRLHWADEDPPPAPGAPCSDFIKCAVHERSKHYLFKLKSYAHENCQEEPEGLTLLKNWSYRKFAIMENKALSLAELIVGSEKGSGETPLCNLSAAEPFDLEIICKPVDLKHLGQDAIHKLLDSWYQYEVAFQPMRPILPPLVTEDNFPRTFYMFGIKFHSRGHGGGDTSPKLETTATTSEAELPLHIVLAADSAERRDIWVTMIRQCYPANVTNLDELR